MRIFGRGLCIFAVLFLGIVASRSANAQDKFYYWVTPHPAFANQPQPESFVVEVNAAQKAEIEAIRTSGGVPGLSGHVAAGSVAYNKNYYAAGQPVWNWHVAAVTAIFNHNGTNFVPCPPACKPRYYANPSDIAADPAGWVQANGSDYTPSRYWIQREIKESERFYYWATPYPSDRQAGRYESFVIELDFARKVQFDELFAKGPVFFEGQIAAGAAPYNKNYHAPGQPVWNWHFTSIDKFYPGENAPYNCITAGAEYWPPCESHPSDIAADPARWIADNGTYYFPSKYVILGRAIDPGKKDAVANVSNRGMTGAGEKTVITGFIISGGEPRTVVLRAIGPSMSSSGVQQPASDPRLTVFSGSRELATNDNWKTDSRSAALQRDYPSLAPTNDNEAALMLTLTPGRYTMHGTTVDGSEGVLLLEAYDVDSAQQ